MPHHFTELGVIILVAALAAIFMGWMRQLPMIGYVIAGILLGPSMMGVIESESQIKFVAELGVILLLFILGMELPLEAFRKSYKPALIVSCGLVVLSLALMVLIGFVIPLTLGEKVVYGFIISLSSTAVAVKLLEAVNLKDKGTGQIAISVLIAQDLLFVPMILILNTMGGAQAMDLSFIPKIIAAVGVLVGLMWYLSRKDVVELPFRKTVSKHNDLIPVAALGLCFGGVALSELAGFSPAFGAFLVGLVIGNSTSKHAIFTRIEPMQNVLIMVFFLSIGMLLDFQVIVSNFGLIMLLLLSSMVFKTVACVALLKASLPKDRWRCSFVSGLTIAQIGEFSFILAAAALRKDIMDMESYKIILAVIALSLVVSPLWVMILKRFVEITYIEKSATALGQALNKMAGRKAYAS